jgi:hypothetical protein
MIENFILVPQFNAALQNNINNIKWDCVEQTLKMTIAETMDFAAYAWFGTMNTRQSETQNDVFADLEKDAIVLMFVDKDNKEMGGFKFLRNTLLEHHLCLVNHPINDPVAHRITIGYQQVVSVDKKQG